MGLVLLEGTSRCGVVSPHFMILSKEAMTAHADRVAGDFYRKHFISLYIVVDRAAIHIHYPGSAGNSDDFDVFPTARAPDFVSAHKRRL